MKNPVWNSKVAMSALAALGIVSLAGCASGPDMWIEQAPEGAASARQFLMTPEGTDARLADLVEAALKAQGATGADEGWQVEAALASRPVSLGGVADKDARAGHWTESPRLRGIFRPKTLHVLTVVLSADEGRDRRVAQVSARADAEISAEVLNLLVGAAALAVLEGDAAAKAAYAD